MSRAAKIVLTVVAVIFVVPALIFAGIAIYAYLTLRPLPEGERNVSHTDLVSQVRIINEERTPVVRSYYRDKFTQLSDSQRQELAGLVGRRLEGELPVLDDQERSRVEFSFKHQQQPVAIDNPTAQVTLYRYALRFPERQKQADTRFSKESYPLTRDGNTYILDRSQLESQLAACNDDQDKAIPCGLEIELNYGYQEKNYVTYMFVPYLASLN